MDRLPAIVAQSKHALRVRTQRSTVRLTLAGNGESSVDVWCEIGAEWELTM